MNQTYLQMCLEAEKDLKKIWKPMIGDLVVVKPLSFRVEIIDEIKEANISEESYKKIKLYKVVPWTRSRLFPIFELAWVPRQNQIQRILGIEFKEETVSDFLGVLHLYKNDTPFSWDEAWFLYLMDKKFGKVWLFHEEKFIIHEQIKTSIGGDNG